MLKTLFFFIGLERKLFANTPTIRIPKDLQRSKDKFKNIKIERLNENDVIPKVLLNEGWQKNKCNVIEIMKNSNATPFRSHTDVGYNCCFCINAYLDPANLKQHTIEDHLEKKSAKRLTWLGRDLYIIKLDITSLHCELCGDSINTIEEMILHLKDIHKIELYTDVKNLIIPFKFGTKMLTCCICSAEFYNHKPLQQHMNQHYRNYVCDICDAGYISQRMLKIHKENHKKGSFDCNYCEKKCTTLANKKQHERIHVRPNALKCGLCTEQFRYFKDKDKHLKVAHSIERNEFKCLPCNKTFSCHRSLMVHTKRTHLKEKKYLCDQCDGAFYSTERLRNHMVKHTGARDFICDYCNKRFGRKSTLREHVRIHANDRRFKCQHCEQSFVQKCSWKGHMRSKHGEVV